MTAVLVFIGPSAIGKTFAADRLMGLFPDHFARVKVYTTRQRRSSEMLAADRIFVSQEEFDQIAQNDDFSLIEHFAGNWYGYRKIDLEPTDRHLIVNAPPYWLPQLVHHKQTVVVGLQASPGYWKLLNARMRVRGDTAEVRAARKTHIERDIQDLEKLRPIINKHGKIFEVENDHTVPDTVIPWIIKRLAINTFGFPENPF